ncbi:high-affinity branched-chain amino acid ABC transporter substrate-binding protein [Diaphorobacter ruginosibacter]|uniref:High-affinity branched-chain amino acid ABC transporter substrate-binding protein n=1 Tax=Diaphorobacter ruginosibacter TaxID=1715720 RepID=A0A7G9RIL9_9BURK|nr:high-affinity branched-chain amino acid ABC transporter substrate-binding protein [Diaphorobacter ruginosibacter]QNN55444.1 high-affinity branched-chain amino acid ABC transporter substrate-binding protein [Diaphorobacter ruginosibacter]
MQRKTMIRLSISLAVATLAGAVHAQSKEPILIGVPAPMTGPNTQYGDELKAGVLTAIDAMNAAGGVQGRQYKPVLIDDACEPKQAVPAANKVLNSGAKFAVAHVCSGVTVPASRVYEDERIVAITPGATAPQITDNLKGHYFFRTIGRDDEQGPFAAKFIAEKLKPKSVVILHDKQTYGSGVAQNVKASLEKAKVPILSYEGINAGDSDYSAVITKIKTLKPELVYFGGYHPEMGLLLRQAREQGLKVRFMGPEGVYNQGLMEIAGPSSEGMLFSFPADFSENPANKTIVEAFKKANRPFNGAYQMPSYAAMQVLDASIKAVGTDPKKVADYMHANSFDTTIGKVAFDAKGDLKNFEFVVFEIQKDGSRKVIK